MIPNTCDDCKYRELENDEGPCRNCNDFDQHRSAGPEMIDHPAHYNQHSIEPIDVIEDWKLNFNLGSTVKYIARCDYKENDIQDLEKAAWYLKREIERRKKHA